MFRKPLSNVYSDSISDQAACHALLNCLIKEFALPLSRLRYQWPPKTLGLPFRIYQQAQSREAIPLVVSMPDGVEFLVLVDRRDALGSQYYMSDIFAKRRGGRWARVDLTNFAELVLACCSAVTENANSELLQQILTSRDLKQAIVCHSFNRVIRPWNSYLSSEQCLWFGHPTHPSPKARPWPNRLQSQAFSPEFQQPLRLHLLELPREGLRIGANGLSEQQVLSGFADQRGARPGYAIISLHPLQAKLLLEDRRMRRLLSRGQVKDLGGNGWRAFPTASLRTLFIEGHPFFIKSSLNVRITNCVRKNAWYELESTLIIDRLLAYLKKRAPDSTADLHYVAEPGTLSWAPADTGRDDERWFREQTGAILRHNFCLEEPENTCLLAGTLFGRDLSLTPIIHGFLAQHGGGSSPDALIDWFQCYQTRLLNPVLNMFFNYGVVFEPHLQNTVVVHQQGKPVRVLLRDYEGVKLSSDVGMQWVDPEIAEPVKRSLRYSRSQGWNRVAYCLFVNNLSEAILALTYRQPHLAPILWQSVRQALQAIHAKLDVPAPELDGLIAGDPIPCKTNLKVRLAAAADSRATYVRLSSPWKV